MISCMRYSPKELVGARPMHEDTNNSLAITCDVCGANASRDVDWLRENTMLPCSVCGNQIDLSKNPWRGEIQRLWNASHHQGSPRRRLRNNRPTGAPLKRLHPRDIGREHLIDPVCVQEVLPPEIR